MVRSPQLRHGRSDDVKRPLGYDWLCKMGRRCKKQSDVEFAFWSQVSRTLFCNYFVKTFCTFSNCRVCYVYRLTQFVILMMILGIACSYALQFYPAAVIVYSDIEKYHGPFNNPAVWDYGIRICICLVTCEYIHFTSIRWTLQNESFFN